MREKRRSSLLRVRVAVLIALSLAGCAQTPEQVIDQGDRFNFTSALSPYSAAICISRNANARGGGVSGQERMLGDADMEVVVRDGGDTLAVAQIRRGAPISSVTVLVTPSVRGDRRGYAQQLMAGC